MIDFKVGQKVGFDVSGDSYCYGRVLAVTETEYAVAMEKISIGSSTRLEPGHVVWALKGECWRDDD